VIFLVSSFARERAALTALCESRGWVVFGGDSVLAARRLIARHHPRAIVMRHVLSDGFSDQLLAAVAMAGAAVPARIVLCAAGTTAATEARQVNLGADSVLRDPVRTEVLLAYLARYLSASRHSPNDSAAAHSTVLPFAGAALHLTDRTLHHDCAKVVLTPREVELIELLVRCDGEVVTYEMLYSQIFDRRFRGDTSNLRVLLGKLAASLRPLDLAVRDWVEVIRKSGYRYRSRQTPASPPAAPRAGPSDPRPALNPAHPGAARSHRP
jgi:DNA-binding response OmpR family regulator